MRILFFLSAILAALTGSAGPARAAVAVGRSAQLVTAAPVSRRAEISPAPVSAQLTSWTMAAVPTLLRWTPLRGARRWIDRLRV